MLPNRIMRETVEVARAPLVESRGTLVRDWANKKSFLLMGVSVQESAGASSMLGREASETKARMYAHPMADVMLGDRVTAHGKTWEVTSTPVTIGPESALWHTVADLTLWRG